MPEKDIEASMFAEQSAAEVAAAAAASAAGASAAGAASLRDIRTTACRHDFFGCEDGDSSDERGSKAHEAVNSDGHNSSGNKGSGNKGLADHVSDMAGCAARLFGHSIEDLQEVIQENVNVVAEMNGFFPEMSSELTKLFSLLGQGDGQGGSGNGDEQADSAVSTTALVGSTQDEHGCHSSGGYNWCGSLGKCLRAWEHECPDDAARDGPEQRADPATDPATGGAFTKTEFEQHYGGGSNGWDGAGAPALELVELDGGAGYELRLQGGPLGVNLLQNAFAHVEGGSSKEQGQGTLIISLGEPPQELLSGNAAADKKTVLQWSPRHSPA